MSYIGGTPEESRREQEQKNEQIREALSYPFNDYTMKERRNLLTASLLGILVVYVGLIPVAFSVKLVVDVGVPLMAAIAALVGLGWELAATSL